MAAPTFVAYVEGEANSTHQLTKTTASLTVQTGDVLVMLAGSADNPPGTLGTPANSGTALDWTQRQFLDSGSNNALAGCWTAVATSSTSLTCSLTSSSDIVDWGLSVFQFRGASVGASNISATTGDTTPEVSLTTTADNSAIAIIYTDWTATALASRTYVTATAGSATEESYYTNAGSTYTEVVAYYPDAGATGAKSVGLSGTGSVNPTVIAIEIKSGAAPPTVPSLNAEGTSITVATTGTSVSPTIPTHQANDILVVTVAAWRPNTTSGTAVLPDVTDWTKAVSKPLGTSPTDGELALYWRRATAAGHTFSVTQPGTWDTGTDGALAARAFVIRDCVTTGTPWDDLQATAPTASAGANMPAVTVSGQHRTVIQFLIANDNDGVGTTPSGWTAGTLRASTTGTDAESITYLKSDQSSSTSAIASGVVARTAGYYSFVGISFAPPVSAIEVAAAPIEVTASIVAPAVSVGAKTVDASPVEVTATLVAPGFSGVKSVAASPLDVTATLVPLGATISASPPAAPIDVTATLVALDRTVGAVSVAISPLDTTATLPALDRTVGAKSVAASPLGTTATPVALGITRTGGGASYNFFGTTTPGTVDGTDTGQVTVGMEFTTTANRWITGIRFYKASTATGTHVGAIYNTSTGALLGSVTFTGETSSGWQTQALSSAVAISPGTAYTVAVYYPNGHYSADSYYFDGNGPTVDVLTATEDTAAVYGNGVYHYGTGIANPTNTFQATNYWIDINWTDEEPVAGPTASAAPLDVTVSLPALDRTVGALTIAAPLATAAVSLVPLGVDIGAGAISVSASPLTITASAVALATTGAVSLAESPATITVTPQAEGVTAGGVSKALSPATITVTPQGQATSVGGVDLAETPATITVTPAVIGLSMGSGPQSLELSPATIVVTPQEQTSTPGAITLAMNPATITVTPVAEGLTSVNNLALSPAPVTVAPQSQGTLVGAITLAMSPATVAVTPVAADRTAGAVTLATNPATITVTPQTQTRSLGEVSLAAGPAMITVTPQGQDRAAAASLAAAPATVTVTPQAQPLSAAVSLPVGPAAVTTAAQALGATTGATSTALTPAMITVTPQVIGLAMQEGPQSLTLTPAVVNVTPQSQATSAGGITLASSPALITLTPQGLARTAAATLAASPATISTTSMGQGLTAAVSLAQAPATISVVGQPTVSVAAVNVAAGPATITVTGMATDVLAGPPPLVLAMAPATITVLAQSPATSPGGVALLQNPATVTVTAVTPVLVATGTLGIFTGAGWVFGHLRVKEKLGPGWDEIPRLRPPL